MYWIEDRNTEQIEVLYVPRDDGQTMLKRRSGDHAVGNIQWPTRDLSSRVQFPPAFGYRPRD